MKIRCVSDSISSENSPQSLVDWANKSQLEITVGKIYTDLQYQNILMLCFTIYFVMKRVNIHSLENSKNKIEN